MAAQVHPLSLARVLARYVTLEGYRDGWLGLKLAVLLGYYYGFMPHWHLLKR